MHGIGYFDGATSPRNPGFKGIGGFVKIGDEDFPFSEDLQSFGTNNEAEYEALIKLLEISHQQQLKTLQVFGDSQLIVRQISGEYSVKKPALRKLLKRVQMLMRAFDDVEIAWISRDENERADTLAKESLVPRKIAARKKKKLDASKPRATNTVLKSNRKT